MQCRHSKPLRFSNSKECSSNSNNNISNSRWPMLSDSSSSSSSNKLRMDQGYRLHHIIRRPRLIWHIRDSLLAVYILVNTHTQPRQVHHQRQCKSDRLSHKLKLVNSNIRYILIRVCRPSHSSLNSKPNSSMARSCIRNPSLESTVCKAYIWVSILIKRVSRSQEREVLFSDSMEMRIISEFLHSDIN